MNSTCPPTPGSLPSGSTASPSVEMDARDAFPMIDGFDDNGLEIIPADECLRILEHVSVARVAVTLGALPVIVPVNITLATLDPMRGPEVLIRTVVGTKLLAALRNAVVAVEADAIEPMSHAGWSVLVRGRSRVVVEPDELSRAENLPLTAWASPGAESLIAIGTEVVTGRRIARLDHPRRA